MVLPPNSPIVAVSGPVIQQNTIINNGNNNNYKIGAVSEAQKRQRLDIAGNAAIRVIAPPGPPQNSLGPAEAINLDENENDDSAIEGFVEVDEPDGTKKRISRRRTFRIFTEPEKQNNDSSSFCKLGCISDSTGDRLVYATPTTGAIKRHVSRHHALFLNQYLECKNHLDNFNKLLAAVESIDKATVAKIARKRQSTAQLYKSVTPGLENKARSELLLELWAVANNISRFALNDPIFDTFLRSVGADVSPNRHTLQERHLVVLDNVVLADIKARLAKTKAVSVSSDGWRDLTRKNWLDLNVYWTSDGVTSDGRPKWILESEDVALLFVSGAINGDVIESLIRSELNDLVLFNSPLFLNFLLNFDK